MSLNILLRMRYEFAKQVKICDKAQLIEKKTSTYQFLCYFQQQNCENSALQSFFRMVCSPWDQCFSFVFLYMESLVFMAQHILNVSFGKFHEKKHKFFENRPNSSSILCL